MVILIQSKTLPVKQLKSRLFKTDIPQLISFLFLGFICFVDLHYIIWNIQRSINLRWRKIFCNTLLHDFLQSLPLKNSNVLTVVRDEIACFRSISVVWKANIGIFKTISRNSGKKKSIRWLTCTILFIFSSDLTQVGFGASL